MTIQSEPMLVILEAALNGYYADQTIKTASKGKDQADAETELLTLELLKQTKSELNDIRKAKEVS